MCVRKRESVCVIERGDRRVSSFPRIIASYPSVRKSQIDAALLDKDIFLQVWLCTCLLGGPLLISHSSSVEMPRKERPSFLLPVLLKGIMGPGALPSMPGLVLT